LRNGNSRTTTPTCSTMDLARHLSLEPHDDGPELTSAERQARALLRIEYDRWRRDNPFSDVLDWSLHLCSMRSVTHAIWRSRINRVEEVAA
jgi:hypothetical protein